MFQYFTAIKFFNVMCLNRHQYFHNKFHLVNVDHNHSTRFRVEKKFCTPFYSKSKCQNAFQYQSVQVWNSIPLEIREISHMKEFKKKVKDYIMNQQ